MPASSNSSNPFAPVAAASAATALSASEDEYYVRLKLELAQVTASTDTKRLQSRTLISERDGRREDAEKIKAETEVQQKIIQQMRESSEKLREKIKVAEDERRQLREMIDWGGESDIAHR